MYALRIVPYSLMILGMLTMYKPSSLVPVKDDHAKKAVIFDLNGVLVRTSMMRAANYLGKGKVGAYFILEGKTMHSLKELLYTVLNKYPLTNTLQLCDPYGDVLPSVFCDVFKGHCTETECYEGVKKTVIDHKECFTSEREYALCLKIVDILFNPETLISLQKTIKTTLQVLKECRKKGHEVFIISNYGKESFELLQAKLPEIFEHVDPANIIISAHVQAVKPEKDMYDILHQRLIAQGIVPHQKNCFFVDDQYENIVGAQGHNLQGIHFKNGRDLRKSLKEYKVL